MAAEHEKNPGARTAQRRLAFEATKIVHGEDAVRNVVAASEVLFGSQSLSGVKEETLTLLREEMPFSVLSLSLPAPVTDVLVSAGACESKGEARRIIKQGGVTVNEARVADEGVSVSREELLYGKYLFIRLGKKRFHLAEVR